MKVLRRELLYDVIPAPKVGALSERSASGIVLFRKDSGQANSRLDGAAGMTEITLYATLGFFLAYFEALREQL
jgi:hypothetical protein